MYIRSFVLELRQKPKSNCQKPILRKISLFSLIVNCYVVFPGAFENYWEL